MSDKAILLFAHFEREKIDITKIWKNSQVDSIKAKLLENKYCYLTGLPRSGKTSTAYKIGVELKDKFVYIRYLDFSVLENNLEIDALDLEWNAKNMFFIIDNWQVQPDLQEYFTQQLKIAYSKGLTILIVSTEYKETKDDNFICMLNPKINPNSKTVDSTIWLEETAKEMIKSVLKNKEQLNIQENEKTSLGNEDDGSSKYIVDLDYEVILKTPKEKNRLNLRYLAWKLQAWQELRKKLIEITNNDILNKVNSEIVHPCKTENCLNTLVMIASVSLFELPYRTKYEDPIPNGIEYLTKKKIIVPCDNFSTAWRMDSTDAQLVMLKIGGENYYEYCIELLKRYVKEVPTQTHKLVWNISSLSSSIIPSNIKAKIITNLLSISDILEKEIIYLDSQIAKNNMYGFQGLYRPIHILFTDINKNRIEEKTKRLEYISKLLTDTVVQAMGKNAPNISFQTVFFFLRYLTYDIARFKNIFYIFFNAYGQDKFIERINNSKGLLQKNILDVVSRFDIELKKTLKNQVIIKPIKRAKRKNNSFQRILEPLMKRAVRYDNERTKGINFLLRINKDILENNLKDNSRKIYNLSKMLECSFWLSEASVIKVIQIIPIILENLDLKNDHANDWRQLIFFSRFAGNSLSRKIIEFLTSKQISQSIETKNANELGFLLKEIEQGKNGIIKNWLTNDIIYIEETIQKILEKQKKDQIDTIIINKKIDMILITLGFLAPEILIDLFSNLNNLLKQNLFFNQPPSIMWPRLGILFLAGGNICFESNPALPKAQNFSDCEPIQFIVAIYAIQKYFSISSQKEILNYLKIFAKPSINQRCFPLVILLSRLQNIFETDCLINLVKKLLFEKSNFKCNGIQHLIYDIFRHEPIQFNNPLKREEYRDHVIAAALYEEKVRLTNQDKLEINNENPENKKMLDDIENVLKPIRNRYLTIHEWNREIKDKMSEENLFSWQVKLGKWEYVKWKIDINENQFSVCFIENRSSKYFRF